MWFNSLAPRKFEWHFRYLIFQIISVIDGWGISCELVLTWISFNLTDDKSTLVQVMAWFCQATSHYLSQWWPRSLSPYGVTRPQWVNCWLIAFNYLCFFWTNPLYFIMVCSPNPPCKKFSISNSRIKMQWVNLSESKKMFLKTRIFLRKF